MMLLVFSRVEWETGLGGVNAAEASFRLATAF